MMIIWISNLLIYFFLGRLFVEMHEKFIIKPFSNLLAVSNNKSESANDFIEYLPFLIC